MIVSENHQNKKCKVEGCEGLGKPDKETDKRYLQRGYCSKHHSKLIKYGDALSVHPKRRERPAVIDGDIAKIPLGIDAKDGHAIVDSHNAWLSVNNRWYLDSHGYASLRVDNRMVRMHHIIMGKPPKGLDTDHINRNKLDNRAVNLRFVTRSVNVINSGIPSNNKSGYKQVSWNKRDRLWTVNIKRNKKIICCYNTKNISDALAMRDKILSDIGEMI